MSHPLPQHFKSLYNQLNADNIDRIAEVYGPDIHFIDPVHEFHGLDRLNAYLKGLYSGVDRCRFDWVGCVEQEGEAIIAWDMVLVHKTFRPGQEVIVPGTSHIRWGSGDRVTWHRDCFDMGRMIYERVPVLGAVIRRIKARL